MATTKAKKTDTKTKKKVRTDKWRGLDQDELIENIISARKDDIPWSEIKELSGDMSLGKLMHLHEIGITDPADVISFKSDADLADKLDAGRKSNLSWGVLSARTGLPEGKIRRIYEEVFGKGSSKLKEGQTRVKGRRGVVAAPKAPSTKPKKSAETKKKKSDDGVDGETVESLNDMYAGNEIIFNTKSGRKAKIKVEEVVGLDGDNLTLIDAKSGGNRTITLSSIIF